MARRSDIQRVSILGNLIVVLFFTIGFWIIGLVKFDSEIPVATENNGIETQAIVVLTGGSGRLDEGLDLLVKALQKMSALVEKYINQGKFQRYLKGNQFKEEYADIDKEIDDAMQIVQLGIGSEVMKQNNQLLQQTKFIMEIDESIKSLKETPDANILLKNFISTLL